MLDSMQNPKTWQALSKPSHGVYSTSVGQRLACEVDKVSNCSIAANSSGKAFIYCFKVRLFNLTTEWIPRERTLSKKKRFKIGGIEGPAHAHAVHIRRFKQAQQEKRKAELPSSLHGHASPFSQTTATARRADDRVGRSLSSAELLRSGLGVRAMISMPCLKGT